MVHCQDPVVIHCIIHSLNKGGRLNFITKGGILRVGCQRVHIQRKAAAYEGPDFHRFLNNRVYGNRRRIVLLFLGQSICGRSKRSNFFRFLFNVISLDDCLIVICSLLECPFDFKAVIYHFHRNAFKQLSISIQNMQIGSVSNILTTVGRKDIVSLQSGGNCNEICRIDNFFFRSNRQFNSEVGVINHINFDAVARDTFCYQGPHPWLNIRQLQQGEGLRTNCSGSPFRTIRFQKRQLRRIAVNDNINLFYTDTWNLKGCLQSAGIGQDIFDYRDRGRSIDEVIKRVEYILQILCFRDLSEHAAGGIRQLLHFRNICALVCI